MRTQSVRNNQRGVALFAVLFAFLLLSVSGLWVMYSTNTDTSSNGNSMLGQVAFCAAMARIHERPDRIQPTTRSITPPTAMPSVGASDVIYIINPKNGETVAPWSTNPRNYPDTELCQE